MTGRGIGAERADLVRDLYGPQEMHLEFEGKHFVVRGRTPGGGGSDGALRRGARAEHGSSGAESLGFRKKESSHPSVPAQEVSKKTGSAMLMQWVEPRPRLGRST